MCSLASQLCNYQFETMKTIELNFCSVATVASYNQYSSCSPQEQQNTVQDGRVFETQGEVHFVMTTALILVAGCPPLNIATTLIRFKKRLLQDQPEIGIWEHRSDQSVLLNDAFQQQKRIKTTASPKRVTFSD